MVRHVGADATQGMSLRQSRLQEHSRYLCLEALPCHTVTLSEQYHVRACRGNNMNLGPTVSSQMHLPLSLTTCSKSHVWHDTPLHLHDKVTRLYITHCHACKQSQNHTANAIVNSMHPVQQLTADISLLVPSRQVHLPLCFSSAEHSTSLGPADSHVTGVVLITVQGCPACPHKVTAEGGLPQSPVDCIVCTAHPLSKRGPTAHIGRVTPAQTAQQQHISSGRNHLKTGAQQTSACAGAHCMWRRRDSNA